MKNKPQLIRSMTISAVVAALTFGNYTRLTGSECIRAIHIVTLLTCGVAIGIFMMSFFMWLKTRGDNSNR